MSGWSTARLAPAASLGKLARTIDRAGARARQASHRRRRRGRCAMRTSRRFNFHGPLILHIGLAKVFCLGDWPACPSCTCRANVWLLSQRGHEISGCGAVLYRTRRSLRIDVQNQDRHSASVKPVVVWGPSFMSFALMLILPAPRWGDRFSIDALRVRTGVEFRRSTITQPY